MNYRVAIPLLFLVAPAVKAESQEFYAGVELARTNVGERTGIKDGLLAVGVDLNPSRNLTLGFSFALQDQDVVEGVGAKGDGYAKYRPFLNSSTKPFVAGGFTAALLKERACEPRLTNVGGSPVVQTICDSALFGSLGVSYQVGASFSVGQATTFSVFFGQFFGTKDVRMNLVGMNASF